METIYAYLAGIIDGEGCISIRRCKQGKFIYFKPMIEVGMTNKGPIELLEKTFGNSAWYEIAPSGKRKLICHKWRVTGTNCLPVLNAISPFLIVKKQQASIAKELIIRIFPRGKHFTSITRAVEYKKRTSLYRKMRTINSPSSSISLPEFHDNN